MINIRKLLLEWNLLVHLELVLHHIICIIFILEIVLVWFYAINCSLSHFIRLNMSRFHWMLLRCVTKFIYVTTTVWGVLNKAVTWLPVAICFLMGVRWCLSSDQAFSFKIRSLIICKHFTIRSFLIQRSIGVLLWEWRQPHWNLFIFFSWHRIIFYRYLLTLAEPIVIRRCLVDLLLDLLFLFFLFLLHFHEVLRWSFRVIAS